MADSATQTLGLAPRVVFSELTFTVKVRSGLWASEDKELLKGVSGVVADITAVTGPSGSGKTTLLDVLGGAAWGGRVGGRVEVDGMSLAAWSKHGGTASYVMQHTFNTPAEAVLQDVLPQLDTPREALTTSALLRLPRDMPREAKLQRVEELLEVLDLQACADIRIGDSTRGSRGLSGGQRRRVTIGIELIKNPNLILLDEPLSGLDSEMGLQVLACLTRLARQGRTICLSVHQAAEAVMRHMDSLILLAGGRLVFQGPWDQAEPFLTSLGHTHLPGQTTSMEFIMHVLKEPAAALQAADAFGSGKLPCLLGGKPEGDLERDSAYCGSTAGSSPESSADLGPALAGCLEGSQKGGEGGADDLEAQSQGEASADGGASADGACPSLQSRATVARYNSFRGGQQLRWQGQAAPWTQASRCRCVLPLRERTWLLLLRFCRWRWRDRSKTSALLGLTLFAGLLLGATFWGAHGQLTTGLFERTAILWFSSATMTVFCSNIAVTGWLDVRPLLRREHQTGLYSAPALFLAWSVEWAGIVGLCVLLSSVQYGMQGLQALASKFLLWFLIMVLSCYASFMLGMVVVLLAADGTVASAGLSGVGTLLVASSGFLNQNPPAWLEWVQEISYLSYSYTSLVLNEMTGLVLQSPAGPVALHGAPPLSAARHAAWGLGGTVGMLAGLMGALFAAAFLAMCLSARLNRL